MLVLLMIVDELDDLRQDRRRNLRRPGVGPGMSCEINFLLQSFIALDALECSLPGVRPHVYMQIMRYSGGVAAQVTFVRLFLRMQCILCIPIMWRFKSPFVMHEYSQILHRCGFLLSASFCPCSGGLIEWL